jgi:hypothetical protein
MSAADTRTPDYPAHESPRCRCPHGSQSGCTGYRRRYADHSPPSGHVPRGLVHSPGSLPGPWFRHRTPPRTARALLPLGNVVQRRTSRQLMTAAGTPHARGMINPGIDGMGLPVEREGPAGSRNEGVPVVLPRLRLLGMTRKAHVIGPVMFPWSSVVCMVGCGSCSSHPLGGLGGTQPRMPWSASLITMGDDDQSRNGEL